MTVATAPPPGFFANIARHLTIWREAWRVENGRPKRGERDFLPAAIEIMEQPASPVGRALIWSLCAFFTIAVAWAIVGKIDIVAVAQGKVVPQLHPAQATSCELPEEARPAGLGLGRADVHAEHLAPTVGIDADRHDRGDRDEPGAPGGGPYSGAGADT